MSDNQPLPVSTAGLQASDREELEALRAATLGDYEILGELGRGGMATVYLGHDIALARKVAIKVMSPVLSLGDGVERFKREARTAASLSHPNIIPIYAVRHTERLLYFVMKYVEGRSLDSIIRELGPLPVPMVQAILGQAASAFGYAHRRGVIHRDIKPGNILIDEEGWAVVTDFGIAKVAHSEQLTSTGLSVGTPMYMSPEQVTAQPVTGASDQYSLGVLAYEMLTGRPPFQAEGMMGLMYAHVHQLPVPLEQVRPDCPDGLASAVMRMLAKEPSDRWASVEDTIAAIGSPSLTPDDPTRSQLMAIAKTGQRKAMGVTTPKSPIPLRRTPRPLFSRTGGGTGDSRAAGAAPHSSGASTGTPEVRRISPVSLALAVGGLLVGVGSIAVALKSRTTPTAPAPTTETATARPPAPAATPQPNPAPTPPVPKRDSTTAARIEAQPPAPAPLSNADRQGVEAGIRAYASALDAGSVAEARRAFPAMPGAQHAYLDSLFAAGGRILTLWNISDVTVQGDRATARVRGATRTEPASGTPSDQAIDRRAVLERVPDGWRLRSMGGPGAP